MTDSLAFILGLLDRHERPLVTAEDLDGEHGKALRLWQRKRFLAQEPQHHPVPSCPHCREGVPIRLGEKLLCDGCGSTVDPRHLHMWTLDLAAFLGWLARALKITGGVQQVDDWLWQLGSTSVEGVRYECFFCRSGELSDRGRTRLLAFHHALLFVAVPGAAPMDGYHGARCSLVELLRLERGTLRVADLGTILHGDGAVRFDEETGGLFAGGELLGEVPVGTKDYFFLRCLARSLDVIVPYRDLKHEVLHHAASRDTTDEATFCHRLRYRIKRNWIPQLDRVLVTRGKEKGYRLRGEVRTARES